jgi:hypothetical protein
MTTLTLAPAAASQPEAPRVPTWFAPSRRQDPLFPTLVGLSLSEVEVALLASGAPIRALDARKLTTDQAVGHALTGLRRIGLDEVRHVAAEWLRINRAYLATPSDPSLGPLWDRELADVRGGWLRSKKRIDAAISVAYYIVCDGIHHDSHVNVSQGGRCLLRGCCRHCYPENFPSAEAAR